MVSIRFVGGAPGTEEHPSLLDGPNPGLPEKLLVERGAGVVPRFRSSGRGGTPETQLLHHVMLALRAKGYDVITKRMARDGHAVAPSVRYIVDRKRRFCIFNSSYADFDSGVMFNTARLVSLTIYRRPLQALFPSVIACNGYGQVDTVPPPLVAVPSSNVAHAPGHE